MANTEKASKDNKLAEKSKELPAYGSSFVT